MDINSDLQNLIEAFKGYRDLLTPIQTGMSDFLATFDTVKEDIGKLSASFDGEAQESLKAISKTLAGQAAKSTDLASQIDRFIKETSRYMTQIGDMVALFEKTEQKLHAINELEDKATAQLKKLDAVIEEKKISYNLRDLQKTLEGYDNNVRKVSDFINKDVAEVLSGNAKKIEQIQVGHEEIKQNIATENGTLQNLLEEVRTNNELLRHVTEQNDVNEEYIFALIDKWAEQRKVKAKR